MAGDLTIGVKLVADSSGVVRGLSLTEAELERLAQRIRRASDDTTRINSQFSVLEAASRRLATALAGVFAVHSIIDFAKGVADAQMQMEAIKASLLAATGSSKVAAQELDFLRKTTDKLGQSFASLAPVYARLLDSMHTAGIAASETHKVFTALETIATAQRRPVEDVQGVLIQMEQSASQHAVHMQDLRIIAQHMSGAFDIATRAAQIQGDTFAKVFQHGGIRLQAWDQALEEHAQKYVPAAIAASDSLQAQLNRVGNAWFDLKVKSDDGAFAKNVSKSLQRLIDTIKTPAFKDGMEYLLDKFAKLAGYGADIVAGIGRIADDIAGVDPKVTHPYTVDQLKQMRNAEIAHRDLLQHSDMPPQLMARAVAQSQAVIDNLSKQIAQTLAAQTSVKLGTVTVKAPRLPLPPDQSALKKLQDRINKDQWNFEWNQITKKPAVDLDNPSKDLSTVALPKHEDIGRLQEQYEKLTKSSNSFVDSIKATLDPMQALQQAGGQMTAMFIDGLTSAITSGKSFGSVLEDITKQIGEMIIKLTIEFALEQAVKVAMAAANGAAFSGGNVVPFARGGVVTRPTLFPFANGTGLMGEAGPEAIMPLKRLAGGKLGVHATGGGVVVNINNNSQATATATQRRGPDGRHVIDVTVEDSFKRLLNSGRLDTALAANAGTKRPGRF